MNAVSLSSRAGASPRPGRLRALWREALARERTLTVFALLMGLAMLPTLAAHGLDERSLRGVGIWVKPLKFMASIGLFALTTAWFVGLLPPQRRRDLAVRIVVWTIVAAGLFEIGYITLQAALGQASHYNFSDALHIAMYSAMGIVATLMTATQLVLAWQIARHGRDDLSPVWRRAVLIGLVITFVLGAGAGGMLGSMQAPAGVGLPVLGWHLAGADLRPAHFLGLHAQQLIPLAGLALTAWPAQRAQRVLGAVSVIYVLAWGLAVARGLDGAQLTVPYGLAG